MPKKFVKPMTVVEKQEIILNAFDLKENDCVRIHTEERKYCEDSTYQYEREVDYKIIKVEDKGYILKKLGGEFIAPLIYLLTLPWIKVPKITEFGNCKCEDVDCKVCPLLYINLECGNRYIERCNTYSNPDEYSYFADVDIKAKRNEGLYKSTVRQIYDNFNDTVYPSKYKCLINWNAVSMELEKIADVIEKNGVTYFKKHEKEEDESE